MRKSSLIYKDQNQSDAYTSAWSWNELLRLRLWEFVWNLCVRWLPKPAYPIYIYWLKCFGCKVTGHPFVAPSVRIFAPWLLTLGNKSCIGYKAEVYNLGPVTIKDNVTIAQYAYLCNGTHDLSKESLPLQVGNMYIGSKVFIGAKALVLPGIYMAEGSVLGAGGVLASDTEPYCVYVGNPATFIKKRIITE